MRSFNLINGNIITLNPKLNHAHSLSIDNGKIKYINKTIPTLKTYDLKGATVIPGFIDAHFHLKNYGKRLEQIDLKNIKSIKEIRSIIKNKLKKIKKGDWVLGFGWDQNLWDGKRFPSADILDNLTIDNPVYLTRIDGHAAWVNKSAIAKTNCSIRVLSSIDGGQVINDCIMLDNTMSAFKNYLPKENKDQVKKWIALAANNACKMGITGVHDAWQDRVIVEAIKELIEENNFPIRCYGMLASSDTNLINEYFTSGHYNDEYLTIRSVKAFIDGALGSRGAALHEPYCDDHHNCGLILISKEEFSELAKKCYQNNFQLNTHAIGDRGNDYVLNCYGKTLGSKHQRRWRIEHAQMVSDNDIIRFKEHQILPSMQPSHCTSDMPWLSERIGKDRLKLISRWQSFIDIGLKIPGGSDCPIETGNPLFEFYAAVTRQNHDGFPSKGFQPQEKINKINALKMFTTWAAYGGFDEQRRGKIQEGFDADLTIINNDILSIQNQKILETKIIYTVVNGTIHKINS